MSLLFGSGIVLFSIMGFLIAAASVPHGILKIRTVRNPFPLLLCVAVLTLMSCFSALNAILLARTTLTFGDIDGFHAAVLLASGEVKAVETRLGNGDNAKFELLRLKHTLVPHGEYRQYYLNGKLERILKYYFGVPHGSIVYYYPDGQIAVSGDMSMGIAVGEWKYLYPSGRIAAIGNQSDKSSWQYYGLEGETIGSMTDSIGVVSANFHRSGVKLEEDSVFYFDVLELPVWVQDSKGIAVKAVSPFSFPVP